MTDLILSILHSLDTWDAAATIWLNGWHTAYFDNFMEMVTGRFVWIPFYLSFGYVMYRHYQLRACVVCVLAALLLLTVNDQLCSSIIRHAVGRLRPSNPDNPISAMIHIVDGYRGGRFGFPSAHATNSWGFAFFMALLFRRGAVTVTMMLWAALMCYSRIYLGVHYVGDIVAGMLLALCNVCIVMWLLRRYEPCSLEAFRSRTMGLGMHLPTVVCGVELAIMLVLAYFVDLPCKL